MLLGKAVVPRAGITDEEIKAFLVYVLCLAVLIRRRRIFSIREMGQCTTRDKQAGTPLSKYQHT